MSNYFDYLDRARLLHGDRFDTSELHGQFIPYFNSGERIRVSDGGRVRTGHVVVSTGWRPVFLLKRRSSDHGSSDVLSSSDQVTHVQRGRKYFPI